MLCPGLRHKKGKFRGLLGFHSPFSIEGSGFPPCLHSEIPRDFKKKKKCCLGPSPDILGCVLSNRIFYSVNQPDGAQPWLQIVYHSMCFYTSLCVYGALNNTVACVLKMYENCILLSVPLGSWFFTLALFGCIWG